MNAGKRLKELIQQRGLRQADVAEKMGVNHQNISLWGAKSTLSTEVIEQFCNALNIPLWQFFISDEELAQIKTGGKQIPGEYITLIEEMMKLDQDIRNDIWEIFLAQLKLFRKTRKKGVD